ncbi:hypothetical protein AVEN_55512-1 [Araneus ventricosus]|uniref:Uncharacterized protein n=1 Tax=Araneus ventricosus TaxID=182803 RepID=A0A4Y2C9K0_ARAVE|nr:hypothetical protein AVEN_55512-1 [Araneus ventricosus]
MNTGKNLLPDPLLQLTGYSSWIAQQSIQQKVPKNGWYFGISKLLNSQPSALIITMCNSKHRAFCACAELIPATYIRSKDRSHSLSLSRSAPVNDLLTSFVTLS